MRFLFPAFLLLAACSDGSERDLVVLQHPDTKQTVECRTHSLNVKMYTDVKNCAEAYEKAGYVRVSDYKN